MAKRGIDPYQLLANAIIVQACDDYRNAYRAESLGKEGENADNTINEVLDFFHSEWFKLFTNLNVNYLVKKLNEDVIDRIKADYYKAQDEGNKNIIHKLLHFIESEQFSKITCIAPEEFISKLKRK